MPQPRMLVMPIAEYESNNAVSAKGKRVIVEMISSQSDMTGVGFFNVRTSEQCEAALKGAPEAENNSFSLVSEGDLFIEGTRLNLSYEESAVEGVEGCSTVISFDLSDPECVTIERRGPLSSVFVISKGERLFSTYSTPFGMLDMCVFGKKVENFLTEDGGSLVMDYGVELKGLTAQRTRMEVKVKCLSQ